MIKKLYKKSIPVVFSLLALTGCDSEQINDYALKTKHFVNNSTNNLANEFKSGYDDSMLKKWYKIQDKKDFAERMLGSNDYENYDVIIPFPGGKWTRSSFAPVIGDIFKSYIGFKESWCEKKKELHLEHYTQYLDEFLLRIGKDADLDENDVLSLDELEGLKEYRSYLNGVVDI